VVPLLPLRVHLQPAANIEISLTPDDFWGRSERDTLRLGARALGAAAELHYLYAPADVLYERIQSRGLEKPPIERDAIIRWFETFQVPTPEELALFDKPLVADLASG
jgi:hypothetical protein